MCHLNISFFSLFIKYFYFVLETKLCFRYTLAPQGVVTDLLILVFIPSFFLSESLLCPSFFTLSPITIIVILQDVSDFYDSKVLKVDVCSLSIY